MQILRKNVIRSLASILIWIGAVEIVTTFLIKMILHNPMQFQFTPIFFACIIAGILLLVVVRV